MKTVSLCLCLLSASAVCSAKPDAAYRDAMTEGRRLEKLGDHPRAAQAFERALAAHPDDAAALSELGWAAFQAGDLARAALVTERAVAATQDTKLKAASLYNLGRIEEQQGEKAKAAESYRQSLALRPNEAVRARLTALETDSPSRPNTSGASVASSPLASKPLEGPFASLEAWCEAVKKGRRAPSECFFDDDKKGTLERPTSPWLMAKAIQSGSVDDRQLRVAAQTPAGWFVGRSTGEATPSIEVENMVLRDVVPGGAPELLIRYVEEWYTADNPDALRWTQICTEMLVVCGLGAGNRPSCTPPLAVREGVCEDPSKVEWAWELDAQFLPDGRLKIAPKRGTARDSAKALLGTHTLVFR